MGSFEMSRMNVLVDGISGEAELKALPLGIKSLLTPSLVGYRTLELHGAKAKSSHASTLGRTNMISF